jgi:cell division protein FtsB
MLLSLIHYQLWFGANSYATLTALQVQVTQQRAQNAELNQRNQRLTAEVTDLKQGLAAIEERARLELGLIKRNEVFYQIVD